MGGELHDGVADVLVEEAHGRLVAPLVLGEEVELVEGQDHGHAIGLRAGQETVDKGGACLRVVDRDDKQGLIDVGGEDVALFAEVGGSADDVVAPVADGGDEGRSLGIEADLHRSPTATGLVLRMPFRRKLPLTLQSTIRPSSALTQYQLPVFLTTKPSIFSESYRNGYAGSRPAAGPPEPLRCSRMHQPLPMGLHHDRAVARTCERRMRLSPFFLGFLRPS